MSCIIERYTYPPLSHAPLTCTKVGWAAASPDFRGSAEVGCENPAITSLILAILRVNAIQRLEAKAFNFIFNRLAACWESQLGRKVPDPELYGAVDLVSTKREAHQIAVSAVGLWPSGLLVGKSVCMTRKLCIVPFFWP
jgi:hypothetical protein